MKNRLTFDIFCKIVDNFGDIGICWRLAKQLQQQYDLEIRFFVDKLSIAKQMLVGIDVSKAVQQYEGVRIVHWHDSTAFEYAADVVVETFACGLPMAYLAYMNQRTVWVNVDHLSAESWVPSFHAGHGKHHDTNLTRHFYFPGFDESTGGLLREQDLKKQRDAFLQSKLLQQAFWHSLGKQLSDEIKISLFSYPNAPIEGLIQSLVAGKQKVSLYMPFNDCLPKHLLGKKNLAVGDCLTVGQLTLNVLPFLSQDDYDKLLWACDINFVRGEDSWVRAIWAGKPFVWQPYWQTEHTHLIKLNAFLETFYGEHQHKVTVDALHQAWSVGTFEKDVWSFYLASLSDIDTHTTLQSNLLIQHDALTTKLFDFCANLIK
jgi:uncharacterized repeat protein (TIGR03837 family)